jgi:hypothetical protein
MSGFVLMGLSATRSRRMTWSWKRATPALKTPTTSKSVREGMTSFGAIIGLCGERNTDIIATPFTSAFAIETRDRFNITGQSVACKSF